MFDFSAKMCNKILMVGNFSINALGYNFIVLQISFLHLTVCPVSNGNENIKYMVNVYLIQQSDCIWIKTKVTWVIS